MKKKLLFDVLCRKCKAIRNSYDFMTFNYGVKTKTYSLKINTDIIKKNHHNSAKVSVIIVKIVSKLLNR